MKILLCSFLFRPAVGGIETVSELLAERFHREGHQVLVVTRTAASTEPAGPVSVLRKPSWYELWNAVRWADVVFHNNVSLRMAWPLLALRRPWVIAHHTWAPRSGAGAFAGLLKHAATRFAKNIAVSEAMARSLNVPAVIIPNPYDESLFVARPCEHRDKDIVFLGRLVSDKGVAVLIEALSRLRRRGHERRLTVIGTGPEEKALRAQVGALKLDTCVEFLGVRRGAELVTLLCQHRILVVPSVWEEPFGVVVLEAIACGLVPIVAQSGGLPDAVGRCGIIVPKSDSAALADAIDSLAGDELRMAQFRAAAPLHLAQHTRNRIAAAYLQVLETTVRRDTQSPAC